MNINLPEVKDFIENTSEKIIIDVRSQSEFNKGHIPNAYNVPVFDDEERKTVGTLYKQQSPQKAVIQGIEFFQKKAETYLKQITFLMKKNSAKKVFLYCSRGGARSESVLWFLKSCQLKCQRLDGGYKAYRNFVANTFKEPYKLILLGGKTGCGKTDILKAMEDKGQQMLDLEGTACHKGSAFGDLGQEKQPSPQQFENNLAQKLSLMNKQLPIWVENESPGIGALFIPYELRQIMQNSFLVNIELPEKERIKRLTNEYGHFSPQLLEERILKVEKRLGKENTKQAINFIYQGDIKGSIEILITYYDKGYDHYMKKNDLSKKSVLIKLEKDAPNQNADIIINSANII